MSQSYGNQNKRIVFYDTDHRHAKLKIKLKHDKLSQADFFRTMITGYLENNINILNYFDEYNLTNRTQSKTKIKKSRDLVEKGRQMSKDFKFDESEIEDLFDIIEKEYPEL